MIATPGVGSQRIRLQVRPNFRFLRVLEHSRCYHHYFDPNSCGLSIDSNWIVYGQTAFHIPFTLLFRMKNN